LLRTLRNQFSAARPFKPGHPPSVTLD
jgi:hypothetical protein